MNPTLCDEKSTFYGNRMDGYSSYEENLDFPTEYYEAFHSDYPNRFYHQMAPYQQRPGCDYRDFLAVSTSDHHQSHGTVPYHGHHNPDSDAMQLLAPRRPLHSLQSEEEFLGVPGPANEEIDHFALSRRRQVASRNDRNIHDSLLPPYRACKQDRYVSYDVNRSGWPMMPDNWYWNRERGYGPRIQVSQAAKWQPMESRKDNCYRDEPHDWENHEDHRDPFSASGKENRALNVRRENRTKSDLDLHWRKPRIKEEFMEDLNNVKETNTTVCYSREQAGDSRCRSNNLQETSAGRPMQNPSWREIPPSSYSEPYRREWVRRREWVPTGSGRKDKVLDWLKKTKNEASTSADRIQSQVRKKSKRTTRKKQTGSFSNEGKNGKKTESDERDDEAVSIETSEVETNQDTVRESQDPTNKGKAASKSTRNRRSRKRRSGKKDSKRGLNSFQDEKPIEQEKPENGSGLPTVPPTEMVVTIPNQDSESKRTVYFRDAIDIIERRHESMIDGSDVVDSRFLLPVGDHKPTPAKTTSTPVRDKLGILIPADLVACRISSPLGFSSPEMKKAFSPVLEETSECAKSSYVNIDHLEKNLARKLSLTDSETEDSPQCLLRCLDRLADRIDMKVIIEEDDCDSPVSQSSEVCSEYEQACKPYSINLENNMEQSKLKKCEILDIFSVSEDKTPIRDISFESTGSLTPSNAGDENMRNLVVVLPQVNNKETDQNDASVQTEVTSRSSANTSQKNCNCEAHGTFQTESLSRDGSTKGQIPVNSKHDVIFCKQHSDKSPVPSSIGTPQRRSLEKADSEITSQLTSYIQCVHSQGDICIESVQSTERFSSHLNAKAPSFFPKTLVNEFSVPSLYIPGEMNKGGLDRTPRWSMNDNILRNRTVESSFVKGRPIFTLPPKAVTWPVRIPRPLAQIHYLAIHRMSKRMGLNKAEKGDSIRNPFEIDETCSPSFRRALCHMRPQSSEASASPEKATKEDDEDKVSLQAQE